MEAGNTCAVYSKCTSKLGIHVQCTVGYLEAGNTCTVHSCIPESWRCMYMYSSVPGSWGCMHSVQ